MKKIFALLLIAVLCHAADKKTYYGYGNVHMMGGHPMVGVGIRSSAGTNGYELEGSLFPYFQNVNHIMFHTKALYLYRPGGKNLYMGAGVGLLREVQMIGKISASLEGSFGFEWHTKRGNTFFLEADAIAPYVKRKHYSIQDNQVVMEEKQLFWPGVTFGFGF